MECVDGVWKVNCGHLPEREGVCVKAEIPIGEMVRPLKSDVQKTCGCIKTVTVSYTTNAFGMLMDLECMLNTNGKEAINEMIAIGTQSRGNVAGVVGLPNVGSEPIVVQIMGSVCRAITVVSGPGGTVPCRLNEDRVLEWRLATSREGRLRVKCESDLVGELRVEPEGEGSWALRMRPRTNRVGKLHSSVVIEGPMGHGLRRIGFSWEVAHPMAREGSVVLGVKRVGATVPMRVGVKAGKGARLDAAILSSDQWAVEDFRWVSEGECSEDGVRVVELLVRPVMEGSIEGELVLGISEAGVAHVVPISVSAFVVR